MLFYSYLAIIEVTRNSYPYDTEVFEYDDPVTDSYGLELLYYDSHGQQAKVEYTDTFSGVVPKGNVNDVDYAGEGC